MSSAARSSSSPARAAWGRPSSVGSGAGARSCSRTSTTRTSRVPRTRCAATGSMCTRCARTSRSPTTSPRSRRSRPNSARCVASRTRPALSPAQATAAQIIAVDFVGTARMLDAFEPHVRPGTVAVCIASMAASFATLPAETLHLLATTPTDELHTLAALDPSALDAGMAYVVAKRAVQVRVEAAALRVGPARRTRRVAQPRHHRHAARQRRARRPERRRHARHDRHVRPRAARHAGRHRRHRRVPREPGRRR